MKFNARTVTKNILFQKANYYEPINYNEQYNNVICKRENKAIGKVIDSNIDNDIAITITDIGCGTGLGYTLLNGKHNYIGIDQSEKSIEYCKDNYSGGLFYNLSAENVVNEIDKLNPMFLFSLDYLDITDIEKFIQKTDSIFIAVHYNKPYLSPTSVYGGKKPLYRLVHPKKKKRAMMSLFERYNANTVKLLGEKYYYVTIIKKGDNHESKTVQ